MKAKKSKPGNRRKTARAAVRKPRAVRAARPSTTAAVEGELLDPALIERRNDVQRRLAERERQRRLNEFDQAVAASRAGAAPRRAGPVRAASLRASAPPLRILAEGDSWFDFPLNGVLLRGSDVIAQLRRRIVSPILNQATLGEDVRQMLGVEQRQRLEQFLSDARRDFNVLLFSGGGNDLVGDQFCLWIRSRADAGGNLDSAIDETAFSHVLGVVRAGYEQLIAMRDAALRARPERRIAILLHAYDFAIPSGRKVCGKGPWLKPSLSYRGWNNPTEARAIVRAVLSRFADLLDDLARRHPDLHVVGTQGTLADHEWNDELHPNAGGFGKIADCFVDTLRRAFDLDSV